MKNFNFRVTQKRRVFALILTAIAYNALNSQNTYTFTNASATGRFGPSQAQVNTAYALTNLAGSVTVVGSGIQQFVVPATSLYRIEGWGAEGGSNNIALYVPGKGAYINGEFNLTAGTILNIVVGQQGGTGSGSGGAGGGGTFVYAGAIGGASLFIAAGGGGGTGHDLGFGGNGSATSVPVNGGGGGNGGYQGIGLGGNGGLQQLFIGTWNSAASGGAGWGSNGLQGYNAGDANFVSFPGTQWVGGYQGTGASTGFGGFGGGGGCGGNGVSGGGAGGYTGGGGGNNWPNVGNPGHGGGQGGGSFNAGTNQVNTAGLNSGHGKVIITQLCTTLPAPTFTSALASQSLCSGLTTTLGVSGAGIINWFSSPSSTVVLNSGLVYVTPTLAAGNYTFYASATNTCGPSARTPVTVTVNVTPTITVNSSTLCSGNSFTIIPAGGISYTISGGASVVTPSVTSAYTVTGNGASGCTNAAVSSLVVYTTPTITVNSGAICAGQGFTMTPGGASTYSFQGGSAVVSPLSNSSYTVTGTSALGCVAQSFATANVTVNAIPVISVNSGSICSGNSFLMIPSGAFSYTFSSGSANVSPLSNTIYSVTGTSAQGCVASNTALCNVAVFATPTILVNGGTICTGNSFTFNPTGAVNYTFVNGSNVVTPLVNSSYTIIGASAQGCTNSAVGNVSVNSTPVILVNNGQICSGQSFTIQPTGANSYSFSGGSAIVSPSATASYTITGMSNGCLGSNTAVCTVTVNQTPTITVNNATVCLGQSYNMNPGGAFTYSYSNGSPVVSPTVNSSYQITGTSAQGCVSSNTAVCNIMVIPSPQVLMSSVGSSSPCAGESLTLIASGASNYQWSNNTSGNNITVAPAVNTIYSVIGTSANGCTGTASLLINVNSCTGIYQITSENSDVNVYPNPSAGLVNITLSKVNSLDADMIITNTLGQVVVSKTLKEEHTVYDISNLPKGIYICTIKNGANTSSVRLIKQ